MTRYEAGKVHRTQMRSALQRGLDFLLKITVNRCRSLNWGPNESVKRALGLKERVLLIQPCIDEGQN